MVTHHRSLRLRTDKLANIGVRVTNVILVTDREQSDEFGRPEGVHIELEYEAASKRPDLVRVEVPPEVCAMLPVGALDTLQYEAEQSLLLDLMEE